MLDSWEFVCVLQEWADKGSEEVIEGKEIVKD